MPICEICGKNLKNPMAKSHINSKFHQKKVKVYEQESKGDLKIESHPSANTNDEFLNLKSYILNLEKRIIKIENQLKSQISNTQISYYKFKPIDFERELINLINQKSNLQRIQGNFIIKELRDIFLKDYNISNKEFEDNILRLYRKQLVDLQPGGNPDEYHLLSPTGMRFYYLMKKN